MWILLLILLFAGISGAQTEVPPVTAPDPMAQADALYEQRANIEALKQAIKIYEDICAKEPTNYESRWRLARCMYDLGSKTLDRKAKAVIAQKGIDVAKKAVELQPKKAEGHFWLGVCYGIFGEAKGIMKSLGLVGPIKDEMNIVLKIDPNCEGGGADRVLGRMYYRLPWIAGGSKKKSLEYLLKSLQLAPANTLTKLYLCDTYWSLGQKDKAKKELEEILSVKPDPRWIPETLDDQKEARRRLDNVARGKKPSEEEDD
ncbi:MAG: tetratricopeptide repeat protein [Acidobacteriota bacterium]